MSQVRIGGDGSAPESEGTDDEVQTQERAATSDARARRPRLPRKAKAGVRKRRRLPSVKVAKRSRGIPAGVLWHRAWNDLVAHGAVPAVASQRSAAGAVYRAARCAGIASSWAMVCAALAQTLSLGEEVAVRASDRRLTGTVQEQVEGTVVRYMAIIGLDWGS